MHQQLLQEMKIRKEKESADNLQSVKRKTSVKPEVASAIGRRENLTEAKKILSINNQTVNVVVHQNMPGSTFGVECRSSDGGTFQSLAKSVRSDLFAQKFCDWYYGMVNRLQPQFDHLPGEKFGQDVFVSNSTAVMYLIGPMTTEKHAHGQANTFRLLRDTFCEYGLLFTPNLATGIQALKDHGMVRVCCCGTLHHKDSVVGIFEQEFVLECSQVDRNWKILSVKLNLKQSGRVMELPSLPPCQVFDVET